MTKLIARFRKNESGATAIEYALIAGLIAVVIIGGASALGTDISQKFSDIAETVRNAGNAPATGG
ncbi:pilus assembly protein Flp/PilA [Ochrobactrum intermedium]|uniref:Pilus assembly protein Flp/PilA n=1 Tax=Brucella intermedia TaxID=94625 RepID=A0ABR6AKV7_9HYPH|nr:Flp family type IVb pilin [Brucella intermedia]MBA8850023.1 pilus assembly protein Flp/PilA [Brucella intermedia]